MIRKNIDIDKRRILFKEFFESQLKYFPFTWMFCNRTVNNRISQLHEGARRLVQIFFFFSIWVFFHEHSRFTGQQGKGEGIYLTPLYHFHPLHGHLDISRAVTAESSPLHIASSRALRTSLSLSSFQYVL